MKRTRKQKNRIPDRIACKKHRQADNGHPAAARTESDLAGLRRKAEAVLREQKGRLAELAEQDADQVIHELGTYQIELEMQNEDLRRAQEELEEAHRRLVDLYDFAPVGYFTFDPEGMIASVNLTGASMLGRSRDELIHKPFTSFVHQEEMDKVFLFIRNTVQGESKQVSEFRLQVKGGAALHVQFEGVPIKNDAGIVGEIRATATDISERIKAEHRLLQKMISANKMQTALAEQDGLFRSITEASFDIIFQFDRDGRNTYVSPSVQKLGYRPEQVQGRTIDTFVAAEDLPKAEEAFREVLKGKKVNLLELKLLKADGTLIVSEISASPIKKGDAVEGVQGIVRDITERRQAEEKIRLSNELFKGINSIFEEGLYCKSAEQLAEKFLEIAEQLTGSRFGLVGEIGDDGIPHNLAISVPGREQCANDQPGHRRPPGRFGIADLSGRVLAEGKPLIVNEPASHPEGIDPSSGEPPLNAFLGVPLLYRNKSFGLIALANRTGGYRHDEIETVARLAQTFVATLFKYRAKRALKESETRERSNAKLFKQFLDFTPIPVWIAHDPECRIITSNLAAARLLEVEPDRNISPSAAPEGKRPQIQIFRDGSRLAVQDMPLQSAIRNNIRIDDLEMDLITPSGKTIRMLGAATPLYDVEGNVQGGIGAFIDITERKWLEEQLLLAKQEWEKTFDALPDLIAILDPRHRIMRINKAMADKLGLTPGQCIGRHCFDCIRESFQPIRKCPNILTLQDGREHTAIVHDEKLGVDYLVTTTPLCDDQGIILATVHVARDVTWLKESERLLQENEKRLKLTQKIAHLGSWELDTINNTLTWSDEVFRMFGLEPQSFVPRYNDFLEMVHPDDREKVHRLYTHSLREGTEPYETDHRIVQKSTGNTMYLHEKCEHLRDETGRVIKSLGIVHDITERKLAEEQILILNKYLQQSVKELKLINQEYERSNQDLRQYANIISHDLQEPLRTVSSFVQLLSRRYKGRLDDKADTFISYALQGTIHMQKLLQDLLAFSKVGGGELHLQPVSLESVVEKNVSHLTSSIEESKAEITWDVRLYVEADEVQLNHLFQNLIGNALKFRSEKPPRIHISAERDNEECTICVRDNGIGIDPKFADRIFLLFQRLHRKEEYEGTGLGLAICKKVVERHGGRIWVESEPGAGAAFYFSLPAGAERDEVGPAPKEH